MKHRDYQSSLTTYLLRRLREPTFLKMLKGRDTDAYEFRVWTATNRLDQCITELKHHLDAFPSIRTSLAARVAVKTYIVSWRTLTDAIACLMNEAFDLGLHQKDVSLGLVFRNSHVRAQGLQDIIKQYQKVLETPKHIGLRNQIVHQGFLEDTELGRVEAAERRLQMSRLFGLSVSRDESAEVKRAFKAYVQRKQEEFQKHLEKTVGLIEEIVASLRNVVEKRSRGMPPTISCKRQPQDRA